MTIIITLTTYFLAYALIKLLNYHFERQESLRVARLYDIRYLKRDLLRQLRAYIFSFDTLKNRLLFSYLLSAHLLFYSFIVESTITGNSRSADLMLFILVSIIMCLVLVRRRQSTYSHLLDNHLLVSVLFLVLLSYLPELVQISPAAMRFPIVIVSLPIVIAAIYQFVWLKENTSYFHLQRLLHTMFVFLMLSFFFNTFYFSMEPSIIKFIIVFLHSWLACNILLSYKLNTVDLKTFKKTKHHTYTLSLFAVTFFVFLFGGLFWQA